MSDILTRLLLNTNDFDSKLEKAKKSSDGFSSMLKGKVGGALKTIAGTIGVAVGATEAFKKTMDGTQSSGDALRGTMHALKTGVDEFFYSVNTGNLSNFIANLDRIASKGKEAYAALDQLGNTQISYGVFSSKNQAAIADAQYVAKNKFAPTDDRISAFAAWGEAIMSEQRNAEALQRELENTVTKLVSSRTNANIDVTLQDLVKAFEADLLKPDSRDLIKERAKMGTLNYEANAARKDWTQQQKDELAELQRENLITYTMLAKYTDDELKDIAAKIQQYYQLTGAVKGLGREYNETANEFNNANKGTNGFNPVTSLEGFMVYSGGSEASKNFGGSTSSKSKAVTIPMMVEVDNGLNYKTDIGRKMMQAIKTGEPLPIVTQPIVIEEVVDEDPLPQINNQKVQNMRDVNAEIEVMSNLMSMVNGITVEGANSWTAWLTNVLQATSTAIVAIRSVVAAKTAEGAAAAGASAAASGPFGWLMIAPAIMSALAAFAAIPQFANGGIVGGSSYFGDKLLARVNSGEMILNQGQQARLLSMTNGGNVRVSGDVRLNGKDIYISLRNYMNSSGNKL